jgi:outer membrane protein OmpA-like peptidoglycan-associated protein
MAARAGAQVPVLGVLSIEGLQVLEGTLDNVDRLFGLGFRMAGLTHFFDNEVGGSAHGVSRRGLTPLGDSVLRRMESLGFLVDLAHASPQLIDEVLARATRSEPELGAELRDLGRSFSLRQVREIVEVRELAPEISLEDITFRSGSAAIQPTEAEQLREIGLLMRQMIRDDPREIFLVEGYTDAVGSAAMNLLLSDRRAESVALALTEYFDVPPENMVVQGYGERFLKIPTLEAERLNRRVAVRRITSLIAPR